MLEHEVLLRDMNPDDMGIFMLMKSKFIAEGKNFPRVGRCDNADFAPIIVARDTDYEWEANRLAPSESSNYYVPQISHISRFEKVINHVPYFYIVFVKFSYMMGDKEVRAADLRTETAPSVMWSGRTIYSLLKNMREWSFLVEEPFNSSHPMATYSKLALDTLNPPQSILNEIDAMPDMHLAKFLKGREDYREIPMPYPDASDEMKQWVIGLTERFPEKQTYEIFS